MNSTSPDPESQWEEAATEWLLEREEGFAPGRAEAFAEWRERDPRHAAALARVERTLALLDDLPALRAPLTARVGPVPPQRRATRFRVGVWAAGLAAAFAIVSTSWWAMRPPAPAAPTFEVAGAEPRRVSLADGSVVDLNANSRVEIQFTDEARRVVLTAGDGLFQVAHDPAKPFIVTARGVAVRAIGTAFYVRLAGEQVDVLVAEGKVQVGREKTSAFFAPRTTPVVPLLVAGERTQVEAEGESLPRVDPVAPAEVESLLAWQNRMTSFADVPLGEMVARINRCNALQLELGDPQLGDRRVGGVIDLRQVNAFVHLLEQDGDIVAERLASGKIVLRRAR